MTPNEILGLVDPPGSIRSEYGTLLHDFIRTNHLSKGLDLRTNPSISTVYLAGAIKGREDAHLLSIWQKSIKTVSYDVVRALDATGLANLVSIVEEPRSYNWRLMRLLQEGRFEEFDFCVIDGGMSWYEVGFACCLVERLLTLGGWIVLDNVNFSFRESRFKDKPWVLVKPEEEQVAPQVRYVYEILIQGSPYFSTFRKYGAVAFAQKKSSVWSSSVAGANIEILICEAVERARYDPEFREDLLHCPASTLRRLDNSLADLHPKVRFRDSETNVPIPMDVDEDGIAVVPLDRPSWIRVRDEASLEEMLGN